MTPVTRTLPPLSLTRSPLILVLAQIKITPVMNMEKYVPEIQDRLRKNGFPKFRKRLIRTQAQDPQGNALQLEDRTDWEFLTSGDQVALNVGNNGIALVTTDYTSFEDFARHVEASLQIVDDVVDISGVERIGLRYIDLIEPTAEKPLSWFLSPQILGLSLDGLGKRLANKSETVLETGEHQKLVLRCMERPGGVVLPADLLTVGAKLKKALQSGDSFGILDSDHYVEFPEVPLDYDTAEVLGRLSNLHDALDQSFRKAVTSEALEHWK